MTARLVLLTGSQAGIEAPLQHGYYMIGRHKECQIRPKSRSVSRRHCVLHFQDDRLLAMDLDSTSGSKRNADRFEPKTWVPLDDGDTLKLGKVQFRVCLETSPSVDEKDSAATTHRSPTSDCAADERSESKKCSPTTTEPARPRTDRSASGHGGNVSPKNGSPHRNGIVSKPEPKTPPRQGPADRPSMVSGAAWETFDVAEFLEDEDNVDREERYDKIRSKNAAALEAAEREDAEREWPDDDGSSDSVIDPFDDTFVFDDPLQDGESGSLAGADTSPSGIARTGSGTGPTVSAKSRAKERPDRTPLPPRKREFSMPGWLRRRGDVDSWKLIAAVVLTVAALGVSGWKIAQFIQGPEVRVLQELN